MCLITLCVSLSFACLIAIFASLTFVVSLLLTYLITMLLIAAVFLLLVQLLYSVHSNMFCLLLFIQITSKFFHGTCICLLLFKYLFRLCKYINITPYFLPVPEAARSKAWICCCLLVVIVGSNPVGGMDVCML